MRPAISNNVRDANIIKKSRSSMRVLSTAAHFKHLVRYGHARHVLHIRVIRLEGFAVCGLDNLTSRGAKTSCNIQPISIETANRYSSTAAETFYRD
jgi:hypothetical protein